MMDTQRYISRVLQQQARIELASQSDDLRSPRKQFASAPAETPPAPVAELAPFDVAMPTGVIEGDEIVLLAMRSSIWKVLIDTASWWITLSAIAGLLLLWSLPIPGMTLNASVQLLLGLAALRITYDLIRWIPRWHILTNRRVMDTRGVRKPSVTFMLLRDVQNTKLTVSPIERLLNLGTITLTSRRENEPLRVWAGIANAAEVQERIRAAVRDDDMSRMH